MLLLSEWNEAAKCMYGIARWLFVVPLHGFILLCNEQVENCLTDKQRLFLNVFLSEIRDEKGTGCSNIPIGFYIGHLNFPIAYGHFPAPLLPVLFGNGCPGAGRLSREETARLMSAASTAIDSNDLFTVTNCRLSQNSDTRSNN